MRRVQCTLQVCPVCQPEGPDTVRLRIQEPGSNGLLLDIDMGFDVLGQAVVGRQVEATARVHRAGDSMSAETKARLDHLEEMDLKRSQGAECYRHGVPRDYKMVCAPDYRQAWLDGWDLAEYRAIPR